MSDFSNEEIFNLMDSVYFGKQDTEKLRKLEELLKEYLDLPSSDGSNKRKELRKKLKEAIK